MRAWLQRWFGIREGASNTAPMPVSGHDATMPPPPSSLPLYPIPQGHVRCTVERASVCMGDDATAPNRRYYDVEVDAGRADLALYLVDHIVRACHYLPSVQGGSTWVARVDGRPVAVVTKADARATAEASSPLADEIYRLFPLPQTVQQAPPDSAMSANISLYFDYYLANDPERIVRQFIPDGKAERLSGAQSNA